MSRAGEVHDRGGRRRGAEREHLRVAVLHQRDRLRVAVVIELGERLVAQPGQLQRQRREQLPGVAPGLRRERLALHVGKRIHPGIGEGHHLEVLRVQIRELADLGHFLRVRRAAFQAVHRGARIGQADVRLTLVHAAHVGDARAGRLLDLQAGNAALPHAFERAAERDPRAALRAGHEGDLLRGGGGGGQRKRRDE